MEIPKQIRGFNFVLDGGDDGKKPFEKGWQKKIHRIDDEKFQKHIQQGGNYGVQMNNSFVEINKELYFLIVVDFDKKDFQDKVINQFPETFTTTSGSPKNCVHLWFASDNNKPFKVKNEKLESLSDVIGEGNQIIAVGSKHLNSGSTYSVVKNVPIIFMSYAEIEAILKPYDKSPKKPERQKKQFVPKEIGEDVTEQMISSISMETVLQELGVDTSKNPTGCPFHSSVGGKCLGWNDITAHCFHCDNSWNKFSLIRDAKKLTNKQTFDWFAQKTGMEEQLQKARKEFVEKSKEYPLSERTEIGEQIRSYYDKSDLAEQIWKIKPYFYDKAGLWWLWSSEEYKWEKVDDKDILIIVKHNSSANTVVAKEKGEIIEAMEQYGREKIPKKISKTWIQFKDEIYDISTGEKFKASPEFFVTNPIPYKVNGNPLTPIIDKIFEQWVGEKYIKTLKEIIAYCLLPDYPINRMFCFMGIGLNGKTCFLNLLKKFVGEKNVTSTELDVLLTSRFEITRLYKKLVCLLGETNFSELSQTSIIKRLTGADTIGFEYKNKTPFDDLNYAKIIIATNNLPTTADKTVGFYRRWLIVDFPNTFSEKIDILKEIPEEEYSSLATECVCRLSELLTKREFSLEGTIEERTKRYEEKSNPIEKFMQEFITDEDADGFIWKFEFEKRLNEWCKENRFRQMSGETIGKMMKEKGIHQFLRTSDWLIDGSSKQLRAWIGIKWK